ncbi:hypothetical protein [Shimia abyssi]|uniref:Uncharacterized protein n=1 Tax=Shimia abyssi TaxID=1662395 RepID=A0A2P8FFM0_9RHOB|nr:hypothetical protein [Shimia abyssi]PSL20515.1 hypothetical protein CLV88_103162 [Shimia abyssi]
MTPSDQIDRKTHSERLLKEKLGNLPDWKIPIVIKTVGPFEPENFEVIFRRRNEVVEACRQKLADYTDQQFIELVSSDPLAPNTIEEDWKRFKESQIIKMTHADPAWYAGGFGHPDYIADFEYWSQSPFYTNHEALLLSLGVEPKHFTELQLDKMRDRANKGIDLWPSLQFMLRRREQFDRQFPRRIKNGRINPKDLFAWFDLIGLDVPTAFTSKYVQPVKDQHGDPVEPLAKKPHKRELDTIVQLFTVMAIEYYGYRPSDARSPTPKEIVDAAAKIGISIGDDTVRKYLRLGASFIPEDWEPDES